MNQLGTEARPSGRNGKATRGQAQRPESQEITGGRPKAPAWFGDAVDRVAERIGQKHVPKIAELREEILQHVQKIPNRMQKVTNQAKLALELIDDVSGDRYRDAPRHSVAIAAAALLYAVSPNDVVPDSVPVLGAVDDILVVGIAMRLIQKDLRRYCESKHYPADQYF